MKKTSHGGTEHTEDTEEEKKVVVSYLRLLNNPSHILFNLHILSKNQFFRFLFQTSHRHFPCYSRLNLFFPLLFDKHSN